jgi:hypothetical protein
MTGLRSIVLAATALLYSTALSAETKLDTSTWKTLSAGEAFTLRAPLGTVFKREQGIDSFVASFENPKFKIQFDFGLYSNTLADLQKNPEFKAEKITIDGRQGVLVTGPGKNRWECNDLVTAAYVVVDHRPGMWGDTRLEIDGCTKSVDALATIHEIFRSIVFTNH